jgi:hypothetical protein
MALYRLGSKGDEVKRIQKKLKGLDLYRGPIDGDYGGGTYGAVKAFQKNRGLKVDGIVGPNTWKALMRGKIHEPLISHTSLDYKCLALTGSFETGKDKPDCFAGVSGDFDGQGMSFGVLQWNFGQDTLQTLLNDMISGYPERMRSIFQENYPVLVEALNSSKEELMTFARSMQHPVTHYVYHPWRGMFKALGRTQEFQDIQVRYATDLYGAAQGLCLEYELWSERAVALMFDIKVQNGSIRTWVKSQILSDFDGLPTDLTKAELEVERMKIVANRRSEASNPRWVEDVRARKLCIATGHGTVHGIRYDLEAQFGLRLEQAEMST